MLPMNIVIGQGQTAYQATPECLRETRDRHINVRRNRLYGFLRSKGLNRTQSSEIMNRFESFMFDKMDIDKLIENDEAAKTIVIGPQGFIIPIQAQTQFKGVIESFFNQEEMNLARSLMTVCPSHFIY